MNPPTPDDFDRRVEEVLAAIRHQGRMLAAAEVVCKEVLKLVREPGMWSDCPTEHLKEALKKWEAVKASRGVA